MANGSQVVTLLPGLGFKLFGSGLSVALINEGVSFHLERKSRKYAQKIPAPLFSWLYRCFSMFYFSIIYLKFCHILEKKRPQVICIWNGHRLPEMAVRAAAKKLSIPVAFFENGLLPNSTTMDFSGVNAFSSIPSDEIFYKKYAASVDCSFFELQSLEVRGDHKRKKQNQDNIVNLACRYIFIPFQVDFDSQVLINSPWIRSMEDLYSAILSIVDRIPDKELMFYIKEHPSDAREYKEFYGKHPRILFVSENTENLIRNAEAVITLNSSVGIEAAMLKGKVIVLGNACYAINGITLSAKSEQALYDSVGLLSEWVPDLGLNRAFFHYLQNEYLLPCAWQSQIGGVSEQHYHAFMRKLRDGSAIEIPKND